MLVYFKDFTNATFGAVGHALWIHFEVQEVKHDIIGGKYDMSESDVANVALVNMEISNTTESDVAKYVTLVNRNLFYTLEVKNNGKFQTSSRMW